jgi:CrcB protein
MKRLLIVAVFGGLGSVLRYLVASWVQKQSNTQFPAGTFAVNIIGCGLIGLSGAAFFGSRMVREEYRLAIMVGLLGGFTTFSSYAWESFGLLDQRKLATALWNIALSNVLGLLVVAVAYRVGARIFGA